MLKGEPVEPITASRTQEQSQRLLEEFKKFDPKKGDLKEFMDFIKHDKWRDVPRSEQ